MANKFQRSVLERLELEQKKQKGPAEVSLKKEEYKSVPRTDMRHKDPESPIQSVEIRHEEPIILDSAVRAAEATENSAASPQATVIPASQYLRVTPPRQAKNKTFYLDMEVIEALRAAAKSAGVADSKLVNDILRGILGLDDH